MTRAAFRVSFVTACFLLAAIAGYAMHVMGW